MPPVISTTRPWAEDQQRQGEWLVMRWVSIPVRSIRRPPGRSCPRPWSRTGRTCPRRRCQTRTSSRPWPGIDTPGQFLDLAGFQVIDVQRNALTSSCGDQLTRLLDGFRAADLRRAVGPAAPAGRVHERTRAGQLHCDRPAGAPGCAGHQRGHAAQLPSGLRHHDQKDLIPHRQAQGATAARQRGLHPLSRFS